ncbi:MAG: hypothetical protein U0175_29775 [Caldilineaceae bacterium]
MSISEGRAGEWYSDVHQLFQQWRKGSLSTVSVRWLIASPWISSAMRTLPVTIKVATPEASLVNLALAWLVELLRPTATEPDAKDLRHFTILAQYYGEKQAAKVVYQPLGGSESTFRTNWCKEATAAAADLLRQRWAEADDSEFSRRWQTYAHLHLLPSEAQHLLHLITVSQQPWSALYLCQAPRHLAAMTEMEAQQTGEPLASALAEASNLLQQIPIEDAIRCVSDLGWLTHPFTLPCAVDSPVELHSGVRSHLSNILTAEEQQLGHRLAATCCWLAQDWLTACWHWQAASEFRVAAQLVQLFGEPLLTREEEPDESPLSDEQVVRLATLLQKLPSQPFTVPEWGRIKWLGGRVAQLQANHATPNEGGERAAFVQSAIVQYGEALRCLTDPEQRATLHYQLAQITTTLDSSLADQHFEHCIALLKGTATASPLLVRAYMRRGWLYIQQRPDWVAAEAWLKQARLLLEELPERNALLWSDWYNGWGSLCFCKGEFDQGVAALASGIDLLHEQPNQLRLCKMLHNQGLEFSTQPNGDQQIALYYLQQSLAIAQQLSHLQLQMLCHKAIGGCYFYLNQFEKAITSYQQAYELISGDSDFKAHLCYDLAEAHAMLLNVEAAIRYFQLGLTLAQRMNLSPVLAVYHQLADQLPWLRIYPYKPRMEVAIRLLIAHKAIKCEEYAQTAKINDKTARKDLNDWVEQKLLRQVGKARATTYKFEADSMLPWTE